MREHDAGCFAVADAKGTELMADSVGGAHGDSGFDYICVSTESGESLIRWKVS